MKIDGKVHCFFEQSGTFKNQFIKLGIPAEDYDIQNHFGQTDHVIDLFAEIEKAYDGKESVFDEIKRDDLIMAFFQCIYFCCLSQMSMSWGCFKYKNKTIRERTELILKRANNRLAFYTLAIKMLTVAKERGLRMIMENPYSMQTYLNGNFVLPPAVIDYDRSMRGDYFKKTTAYWFVNCEPTDGQTMTKNKNIKKVLEAKGSDKAGICSEERSMISPLYAHNFICDFILGKATKYTQQKLFEL